MQHIRRNLLFLLLLFSYFHGKSQTVSTLPANLGVARVEAITMNHNGYLYTPSGQTGNLYKIHPGGTFSIIVSGLASPFGGAVDNDTCFYFSEYNTGRIFKVRPDDSYNVFATGFSGPTGIALGPTGDTLYVSNYNNDAIYKVAMADSSVHPWIQNNGISGPDGLVFDPEGNLYIANFDDNLVHKVDTNDQISQFAALSSSNSGYITLVDSTFYICGFFSNQVHAIDMAGNDSVFAGTGGPGYRDGAASFAKFYRPNGMARNAAGDTLYVTDGTPTAKIRIIDLYGVPTGLEDSDQDGIDRPLLSIGPNPFSDQTTIQYELSTPTSVELFVVDPLGKRVATLSKGMQNAGSHQAIWRNNAGNGQALPAGNYQVVLEKGNVRESITATLIR